MFQSLATSSELDLFVVVLGSGARILTLPVLALLDLSWWPLARLTVARSGWTVVRVDFDGVDAEFVRVGNAETKVEAERLRRELASQPRPSIRTADPNRLRLNGSKHRASSGIVSGCESNG